MKAKLIKVLNVEKPEMDLFGVRITGLRRKIYGYDSNGLISKPNKDEVLTLINEFNNKFIMNPQIETQLREDKTIQAVKI